MDEQTKALIRIAETLENAGTGGFLSSTGGQIVAIVVAALVGALLTYTVRRILALQEAGRREQELLVEHEQQRRLVKTLLRDEIRLRWKALIETDLSERTKKFNVENLTRLTSGKFSPDDLFVFKLCANDLNLTTSLGDESLVSKIVYVHLLTRDLSDALTALRDHVNLEKEEDWVESGAIKRTWGYVRENFEELQKEMDEMLEELDPPDVAKTST